MNKWAVGLHGGSGVFTGSTTTFQKSKNDKLKSVIKDASIELEKGIEAIDVVTNAISKLEDDPTFNAGTGSVVVKGFKHKHQMDACIINGKNGRSGTVISIYGVRNPIRVARSLFEETNPVVYALSGEGAYVYAKRMKLDLIKNFNELKVGIEYYDTVGCVCLDKYGNLAAGNSTGGISNNNNRILGRVGDVGMIGCGTFAKNGVCAISCSGYGEDFIRKIVAYDISCRIEYGKEKLKDILENNDAYKGIRGSCIAMDRYGNVFGKNFNSDFNMLWVKSREKNRLYEEHNINWGKYN